MNDQPNSLGFFNILAYAFAFGLGFCLVPLTWLMVMLTLRGRPSSEAKLRQVRTANQARIAELSDGRLLDSRWSHARDRQR
jgi:hypothetical protein